VSWNNRVIWQEGMFLRSQHFQQQDRWLGAFMRGKVAALRPHPWGLTRITLDEDLLGTGRFAMAAAAGTFKDGTPFSFPGEIGHPSPFEVPENTRGVLIHLALASQNGAAESAAEGKLRYLLDTEDRGGYLCIPVTRILEVSSDKRVTLDERWLPPVLTCNAVPALARLITEFSGLMNRGGEAVAAKVNGPGARGVAEVADFMLLQAINRWQTLLRHWADAATIHPETLYTVYAEMAAEFATFAETTHRPTGYPGYLHDDLQRSFTPVIADLRHALSAMI
jgi:type VI secretion system protein ImpJ